MRLAVILPSRGLIFSATLEEVLAEAASAGCDWDIFFSHARPIPECFNEPLSAALAEGFTHMWVVEEDMVLPAGVLAQLIASGAPVAACDYPVGASMSVVYDNGQVLFTGTGCLLIDAPTLASVMPLRADICYQSQGHGWHPAPVEAATAYGGHDVHLGMTLHARGTPIHVIDTLCDQRRVTRWATPGRNQGGWHDITTMSGEAHDLSGAGHHR